MIAATIENHSKKRTVLFGLLFFVLFSLVMLVSGGKLHAAPLAASTFPNPAANTNGYGMYMTIGYGDFDNPFGASMIMSDTPGPVHDVIEEAQWCQTNTYYTFQALDLPKTGLPAYFSTIFEIRDSAAAQNLWLPAMTSVITNGFKNTCVNRNLVLDFNLGAANFNTSTGNYIAVFVARPAAFNPAYGGVSPAAAENSFRIILSGTPTVRATFLPTSVANLGNLFSISNRNRPANSAEGYSIDFTPGCTVGPTTVGLAFYDADYKKYQSVPGVYADLTYNFSNGPRGGVASSTQLSGIITGLNGQWWPGPSASDFLNTTIDGGHTYNLTIDGLSRINAISYAISMPLSVMDPAPCIPPDTAPTISISQNCALPYTINITVNDADYATNGANPTLNYSINGAAQAAVSARTTTFNMPDGTVGIDVSADSNGVNPAPPGGLGTINASASQNFPRCRAPDSAPTITVTQNCTPPFTITITVNDPDYATNGGNPTLNYSINGAAQAAVSVRTTTFNMPDPTASVVVAANTLGVNPNPPSGLGTSFVSYSSQTFLKCADSFTLTSQPQPPVLNDTELPTSGDFTAPIGFSGSAAAVNNVATNRDFFFNRGGVYNPGAGTIVGGATINIGASVGAAVNVTTKPLDNVLGVMTRGGIPAVQVGDNICIRLTLSPAIGLVNGAGVIFAGASGNSIRVQCTTVLNKPYLKAYGSDILAGVGFGNSCPAAPAANVTAFSRLVAGNWVGAGTQLGAFASGNIVTFATSMLRTPASPTDRAFSNTSVPYPGNFGANFCSDDFWASRSGSLAVGPNKNLTAMSGQYQIAPNQTLLISAAPLPRQFAVYIDGDVTIDKDIITSAGPWASYANIPSVYIIARGNIYIAPTVKRLDGVYVAMPRFPAVSLGTPADGGRIFTCTDNGSTPSSAVLYGACMQNTLTVNGAFAAKHVDFLRGKGTLRTAASAEVGTSGNIAEVFNYSPDLFMTLASPSPRLTTGSYDSVISLPPAL